MSIEYYNKNATNYIQEADAADMGVLYTFFQKYLEKNNPLILDAGCGSGRDSQYFLEQGFRVRAFDASEKMVSHCKTFMYKSVQLATFETYTSLEKFDGIWACASLLHVPEENLIQIIQKFIEMLNPNGIFFMSFKLRNENFSKNGRDFTCMTKEKFAKLSSQLTGIETLETIETYDVREGRTSEKWLSIIVKRVVPTPPHVLL